MSFKALLIINSQSYNVNRFSWAIGQNTDELSRADTRVQGGQLYLELDSQPDDMLHHWALDDTKKMTGKLLIFAADSLAVRKTVEFHDAFCTELHKNFEGLDSAHGMSMSLSLSANQLITGEVSIDNKWPA